MRCAPVMALRRNVQLLRQNSRTKGIKDAQLDRFTARVKSEVTATISKVKMENLPSASSDVYAALSSNPSDCCGTRTRF